jgi:hypothetical protein
MQTVVSDYLWTFKWDNIDNAALYKTCCNVEEELMKIYPSPEENKYASFTTYYYNYYNLFSFPCPELHKLYVNMANSFPEIMRPNRYYIACWANLFAKDKNIGWHAHWPAQYKTYHGFYCVNTQGEHSSYTDYKIPGQTSTHRVMSLDGMCVIGKSEGDEHRSSPWLNDDKYRVTIAFDVIPIEALRPEENFTHINPDLKLISNFIPLYK